MIRSYLLLALLPLLLGCQSDSSSDARATDWDALLLGTWETVEIITELHSVDGIPDSVATQRISSEDWQQLYGVYPALLVFLDGHQYRREHRLVSDSLIGVTEGEWRLRNDTLVLYQDSVQQAYILSQEVGRIIMSSQVDWDGDGIADDEYRSVHRKVTGR